MSEFAPPPGPPPPKAPEVPPGWLAQWNEQYKEWFYVNLTTKQSQWEKPTSPAFDESTRPPPPPDDAPPDYTPGDGPAPSDTKKNPYLDSPQPDAASSSKQKQEEEDARLARELQEQENSRGGMTPLQDPSPGPYAQGGPQPPYQQYPPQGESSRGKGKGLLGKLMGKVKLPGGGGGSYGHARPSYGGPHPPQQGYMGQPGGYPPQPYGQPGFGGPGYGAPGPYGYPQQPQYGGYPQQTGRRKPGMGNAGMMAGGAALGMGAGLVGGALVADAIHDEQQEAYQEGYEDGADGGDFDGGDFGGDF
ncbi:hypothetical protein VUR80DRAFT_2490 [Thermomyces stellatus]